MLYRLIRSALFALNAEDAHGLAIRAMAMAPKRLPQPLPALGTRVAGLDFPSPIGLAAGCDKDARAVPGWFSLGFGAVEVGTLTPLPQAGNPRPRLFRLSADAGVINRMGFNNGGQAAAATRLRQLRAKDAPGSKGRLGPIGINIGANKDSADRIGDYVLGVQAMAPLADYLTLNISSPNTPGLRGLQQGDALDELLARVMAARAEILSARPAALPIFLKVAPDLDAAQIDGVVRACADHGVDALIIGNTTLSRPPLNSRNAGQEGGLSGRPLRSLARQRLRDFRVASGGALTLIAAGGIDSGAEAYDRIRAGASLVQVYSALVYAGPGLVNHMHRDLLALLARDGFATIGDAVGTGD